VLDPVNRFKIDAIVVDLASQPAALSQYILYRGQVTGPYGLYRIYLKVKDKEGNWSNEFQINVFISAP